MELKFATYRSQEPKELKPFQSTRLHLDELDSVAPKDHRQYKTNRLSYTPCAPGPAAATSPVPTEVATSRESTPPNDHREKRSLLDVSREDVPIKSNKPYRCSKLELDTWIKAGRKRIRKDQVVVNVEVINDMIIFLQQLSDYFNAPRNDSESLRVAIQFGAKLMQRRCEDIVAEALASSDLAQCGTLASTQRKVKCMTEEEHFYD
ncbi:uncharacterized protein N7484_006067 [Penicillium longicatenatum]|uniref:uncharacterized protein n=1 Tax=Penicillium longicatenatum TaxID=1561947 RepID=UPI0025466141|nr:uncharacterized protein N7484_006067 [Penicillium longicatenatum]KAJ5643560.1 hypothetical protein N7484_006067 [Penicillium longicatenatum]